MPNRLVASKVTSVMREAGGVLVVLLPSRRRKSGCDLYRRRPCNLHSFSLVWCAGVHICTGCVGRDWVLGSRGNVSLMLQAHVCFVVLA